jgi:Zn-dependent M28 family amino/carboxypeptidase
MHVIARLRHVLVAPMVLAVACGAMDPSPAGSVDRDVLLADLRVLSADHMEGRLIGSPGGARARAYVVERFEASGLESIGQGYEHPFAFAVRQGDAQAERTGVNVVGRVPGTSASGRVIVITAHYDHVGTRGGVVFNGADDNASGTAALFAIGRHFSVRRPAHTLIVAALDGEEGGLRGGRAFVEAPPVLLEAIALNVNLDMVGRDPDNVLYAVGTHHYPFLRPYIEQVASRASITLRTGHDEPGKPGVEDWTRDSDHFVFHERRIPFIYFGVEDFAEHHQATDDYETITHDFYVRAVATIIDAVAVFDANLENIGRRDN